jgi:outer membrane receptor protein involved in Fe transport
MRRVVRPDRRRRLFPETLGAGGMRNLIFLITAIGLLPVRVRAQDAASPPASDEDVVTAPVEVRGTRDSEPQAAGGERALEEPGFVTVVDIDRRRDETASIAEALAETVGVSVRALGGMGAFASISMRGAPAGQTEILVDGVPLSRVAFSSVDVGSLELATFDRVEVLRGGVPAELGGAVLGGAVDFVTRVGPPADGQRNRITVGGGSFGARRVRIARADDLGGLRTALSAGYAGAEGDFDYFDDNGTPLNPADDAERRRGNNGYDAVDVAARVAGGERLTYVGGGRVTWKGQGVPGPSGVAAMQARLGTTRAVADVALRRVGLAGGALGARARGYAVYERQRFEDRRPRSRSRRPTRPSPPARRVSPPASTPRSARASGWRRCSTAASSSSSATTGSPTIPPASWPPAAGSAVAPAWPTRSSSAATTSSSWSRRSGSTSCRRGARGAPARSPASRRCARATTSTSPPASRRAGG